MDEYEGMRRFGRKMSEFAGAAAKELDHVRNRKGSHTMTGIERLRVVAGFWRENKLDDIVEQIEREQGGRVSRMRVLSVVTEMEHHILGHEGMEDSPVARWARELRAALGGDGHDHAADVSVSAYDLLPQENRDAIAWVREHGGLDEVEAHWSGRVPLKSVKRMVALHKIKRERLKAHALGLERKCAERGETIRGLSGKAAKQSDELRVMRDVIAETCARLGVEGTGSTVDDAQAIWREISRRLMPEGMEWLLEAWPRFEDDSPLKLGDMALIDGEADMVEAVQLWIHGKPVIYGDGGSQQLDKGERVKRPVADTWQRIGEDAGCTATKYNERRGTIFATKQQVARDLVRRCRALAERERGE